MSIDLDAIQKTIDYEFENEDLLQQAFVRRSYSEENGGQNNEVLEFIGDKALDLAVIRLMMEKFSVITTDKEWNEYKLRNPKYFQTKFGEGKFTDIKKDLVEKKALSRSMEKLGFHTQLIMGEGDIKQHVENQDSVKEDLFEAIIGAVTVDCDWNMDTITNVVENMIDFEDYFQGFEFDYDDNYVGIVQETAQKEFNELPKYEYRETNYGYECYLYIDNEKYSYGEGSSKAKARMDAAYEAYRRLRDSGIFTSGYEDAVGEPNYERALSQINELYQKKLISKPKFEYSNYPANGEAIWECHLIVEQCDDEFYEQGSTKKEAQRNAAFEALCYLMDYDSDELYEEYSNNLYDFDENEDDWD